MQGCRRSAPPAHAPRRLRRAARAHVRPCAFFWRKSEAKEEGFDGLVLLASSSALAHPDKIAKGGDDAHLVRHSPAGGALAVADGVSGWAAQGIDSGAYSRALLRALADAVALAEEAAPEGAPDPLAALTAAHASTHCGGAATATLCVLDGAARQLLVANIGDSGLLLLRRPAEPGAPLQVAFASAPQQHAFDQPFQLSSARLVAHTDLPAAADCASVALQEGDLVLLASDGLFDNLPRDELLAVAGAALAGGGGPLATADRVADSLAALAAARAADERYESPYAISCRQEAARRAAAAPPPSPAPAALFGALFAAFAPAEAKEEEEALPVVGGKLDDITVVAAVVVAGAEVAGALAAARAAARETRARLNSAVGDYAEEGRKVLLGLSAEEAEAEDLAARTAARMARRAAAAAAEAGQTAVAAATAGLTASVVEAMDAPAVRRALEAKGLPTSGKVDVLRARLLGGI